MIVAVLNLMLYTLVLKPLTFKDKYGIITYIKNNVHYF